MAHLYNRVLCESGPALHLASFLASPWDWGALSEACKAASKDSPYQVSVKEFNAAVDEWDPDCLRKALKEKMPNANLILWYLKKHYPGDRRSLLALEVLGARKQIKNWEMISYAHEDINGEVTKTSYGPGQRDLFKRRLRERGAVRILLGIITRYEMVLLRRACAFLVKLDVRPDYRHECIERILWGLQDYVASVRVFISPSHADMRLAALKVFVPEDSVYLHDNNVVEIILKCLQKEPLDYGVQSVGADLALCVHDNVPTMMKVNVAKSELIVVLARNQMLGGEGCGVCPQVWKSITKLLAHKLGVGFDEVVKAARVALKSYVNDGPGAPCSVHFVLKAMARIAEDAHGVQFITFELMDDVLRFWKVYQHDACSKVLCWQILLCLTRYVSWGIWFRGSKVCAFIADDIYHRVSGLNRLRTVKEKEELSDEIVSGLDLLGSSLQHDRLQVGRCMVSLLEVMEELMCFKKIACASCLFLSNLYSVTCFGDCLGNSPVVEKMVEASSQVLMAMRLHRTSQELQEKAGEALCNLCQCADVQLHALRGDALRLVDLAYRMFPQSRCLQKVSRDIHGVVEMRADVLRNGEGKLVRWSVEKGKKMELRAVDGPLQEALEAAFSSRHVQYCYDRAYIDPKGRPAVWKYRVTFHESGGSQHNVDTRKIGLTRCVRPSAARLSWKRERCCHCGGSLVKEAVWLKEDMMPLRTFNRAFQEVALVFSQFLDVPHEWSHLRACNRGTKDWTAWDSCHAEFSKRFSDWTQKEVLEEVDKEVPRGDAIMWVLTRVQPCAREVLLFVVEQLLSKERIQGWMLFEDVEVEAASHVEIVDDSDTEFEKGIRRRVELSFIRSNMIRWGVIRLLLRCVKLDPREGVYYPYSLHKVVSLLLALQVCPRVRHHCIDSFLCALKSEEEKRNLNGRHNEVPTQELMRALMLFVPRDANYMQGKMAGKVILSVLVSYKFSSVLYMACRRHICRLQPDACNALNGVLHGIATVVVSEKDGGSHISTKVMDHVMSMCSMSNDMPVNRAILWGLLRALVILPRWKAWMREWNIGQEIVSSMRSCMSVYLWKGSTVMSAEETLKELSSGMHALALVLLHDAREVGAAMGEVVNAMRVFASELRIQKLGCSFVACLCWSSGIADIGYAHAAHDSVLSVMRSHQDDPELQRLCCEALFALCCCVDARVAIVEEGGLHMIRKAIWEFAGSEYMEDVMEHSWRMDILAEQARALAHGQRISWRFQSGKKRQMADCSKKEHERYEGALWRGLAEVEYPYDSFRYLITFSSGGGLQKNLVTGTVRKLERKLRMLALECSRFEEECVSVALCCSSRVIVGIMDAYEKGAFGKGHLGHYQRGWPATKSIKSQVLYNLNTRDYFQTYLESLRKPEAIFVDKIDNGSGREAELYVLEYNEGRGDQAGRMYHGTSLQGAQDILRNGFKPSCIEGQHDFCHGPGVYVARADPTYCYQYATNCCLSLEWHWSEPFVRPIFEVSEVGPARYKNKKGEEVYAPASLKIERLYLLRGMTITTRDQRCEFLDKEDFSFWPKRWSMEEIAFKTGVDHPFKTMAGPIPFTCGFLNSSAMSISRSSSGSCSSRPSTSGEAMNDLQVEKVWTYTDSEGEPAFMYQDPANGRWYFFEGPLRGAGKFTLVNLNKVAESIQCP